MASVDLDARGPVRLITLNRPERKNALDLATWDALRDALRAVAADPTAGCAVLTGAGDAFCAGMDLNEFADPSVFAGVDVEEQAYSGVMRALADFDVPLIAAVNGVGVGFGMTVLPLCDLVVMADTARLKLPFVDMGVTTEGAASYLLPTLIGWQETARLVFTGDWLSADEAKEIGLAWKVVPRDQVVGEALALAERIGGTNIDSVRTSKRMMMAARADAVAAAQRRELAEFARMMKAMRGE